MGVEHNVKLLDKRNEVAVAYASHAKLRCFFNPPKTVPLDQGLVATAAFAKRVGKMAPTGFSEVEVRRACSSAVCPRSGAETMLPCARACVLPPRTAILAHAACDLAPLRSCSP